MHNSSLLKTQDNTPYLLLAPMEGVGDACFRMAMAKIGGFDEAVRDFLRVPCNAHVKSLAKVYDPLELGSTPLAAQIMGSDPVLMAEMAEELQRLGAFRIDVNCGCPSNTVTGRGAGSSLLKDPMFLHTIVKSVVSAISIPVTVKMRSGYEDTSLFLENLKAAEESGISYLTLHPRTKVQGYGPPADWSLIRKAKEILKIPVVGNGDIRSKEDAALMLETTRCDALMIGRASVRNPFIFQQIKAHFRKESFTVRVSDLIEYISTYAKLISNSPEKSRLSRLKQLLGFVFSGNSCLEEKRLEILRMNDSPEEVLARAFSILEEKWKE